MASKRRYRAEIVSIKLDVHVSVRTNERGDSGKHFSVSGDNRAKVLDDLDFRLAKVLYQAEEQAKLDDKILGNPMTEEEMTPPQTVRGKRAVAERDEYLEFILSKTRKVAPAKAPLLGYARVKSRMFGTRK